MTMGRARREALEREKKQKRQKQLRKALMIAAGCAACIMLFAVVYIVAERADTASQNLTVALSADGSLHVESAKLKSGFNYVDWGGAEELILYRDGNGDIQAAFDTCEECYTLDSVHFNRHGDEMICQVCGTVSALSTFGEQEWGGCRPVAVPTVARLDTDTEIIISGAAMTYAAHMFEHWDTGDLTETFAEFEG